MYIHVCVCRYVCVCASTCIFMCVCLYVYRWLAKDEDDGQIERELTAGGSQMLSSKYCALLPFTLVYHVKKLHDSEAVRSVCLSVSLFACLFCH